MGDVEATCPLHRGTVIARWRTFDGERVLMWQPHRTQKEYVGDWQPTEAELRDIHESPLQAPAGQTPPGDVPHWRLYLPCPVDGCKYDPMLRSDSLAPIGRYACALWRAGIEQPLRVDNIEQWLREVATRS